MAQLLRVRIQGYRPFRDFHASLGSLEVLVGANGAVRKSSLFEFLKFIRDGLNQDIPPEIIPGTIGQRLFHSPGPDKFSWDLRLHLGPAIPILDYSGTLLGPIGQPKVTEELVETRFLEGQNREAFLAVNLERGYILDIDRSSGKGKQEEFTKRTNQLALRGLISLDRKEINALREFILNWRFYNSFTFASERIRRATLIEQDPILKEDASNISSVLHYLKSEHPSIFEELQQHLSSIIPGFLGLTIKARGGPGEVMAFWQEKGIADELTLADLSDGVLRLICWIVLCLQPNPPTLMCIDEPDQGVHPRTLPILAGLFEKASDQTQILLATHSSYFLTQFELSRIGVFRKEDGAARFMKPSDSKILTQNLADFGSDELEVIHRNDELERLA